MGSLPAPRRRVGAVIDAFENGAHFDEVKAIKSAMIAGENELRRNAAAKSAASTTTSHTDISKADEEHLSWIWSRQFSGRVGQAGQLYDKILTSTPDGNCPICGKREADEVDHHLPKKKYPRMSIVPVNMVPMCHKCNNLKRTFVASNPSEEPFHPYFDDLGSQHWLVAKVRKRVGAPLIFSIDPDPAWGAVLTDRVEFWFRRLRLSALYAQGAAGILSGIQQILEREASSGGASAVRAHLIATAESWEHSGNSAWLPASYRAWARSDHFCKGGWRV